MDRQAASPRSSTRSASRPRRRHEGHAPLAGRPAVSLVHLNVLFVARQPRGRCPCARLADVDGREPGERDRDRRPDGAARPRGAPARRRGPPGRPGRDRPTSGRQPHRPSWPPERREHLAQILDELDRRRARRLPRRAAAAMRRGREAIHATPEPEAEAEPRVIRLFRAPTSPPYRAPIALVLAPAARPGDREPVPARAQRRDHQQRRGHGRHRLHPAHRRVHARRHLRADDRLDHRRLLQREGRDGLRARRAQRRSSAASRRSARSRSTRSAPPSLITRNTNDVQQVQTLVLMALNMMISAPILTIGGVIMALRQDVPLIGDPARDHPDHGPADRRWS